jgi:hypothetical protein
MRVVATVILVLLLSPQFAGAVPCFEYPADQCGLPAEYSHSAVVEESGIRVTFASTRSEYLPGETIDFQLQFENIGAEYFCMNWAYMPIDVVFVLPDGCNAGADFCAAEQPWGSPNLLYYAAGVGVGLEPGECRVFSYSWDTVSHPAVPGSYEVLSGIFEFSFDAAFGAFRMPSTGVALNIEVLSSVPLAHQTLSVMKARYR